MTGIAELIAERVAAQIRYDRAVAELTEAEDVEKSTREDLRVAHNAINTAVAAEVARQVAAAQAAS